MRQRTHVIQFVVDGMNSITPPSCSETRRPLLDRSPPNEAVQWRHEALAAVSLVQGTSTTDQTSLSEVRSVDLGLSAR